MADDPGNDTTRSSLVTFVPLALLVAALSYATESQGAFYNGPFHVFVILVALALIAAIVAARSLSWAVSVMRDPLVWLAVVLSVVTVVSSAVAGQPSNAWGTVALLLMLGGAVAIVRALPVDQRRLLVAGVVAIAVVVAAIGWVATVGRWQPDALTSQGLWRAASTLTYENALAAFLTAPALLCLDRLMTMPHRNLVWSQAAFVLLLGIGASLSRGGVLGLGVGVVVLVALRGPRTVVRLGPPVVGAVIALACLAPSLPVASSRHVILAVVGLGVGALATAWTFSSPWRRRSAVVGGAAVVVGVLVVISTGHVAGQIAQARLSASSSDRAHEWSAAIAVARHHLVLGVGTARVLLQWQEGGRVFTATFAHNEFLQLLVQDGVVGLGVLVLGLAWVFLRLWRLRCVPGPVSAQCAIASLASLLIQSSLDFLWHLPVIPVLMAVVVAVTLASDDALKLAVDEMPSKRYDSSQLLPEAGV
jgi:hypothetical protein